MDSMFPSDISKFLDSKLMRSSFYSLTSKFRTVRTVTSKFRNFRLPSPEVRDRPAKSTAVICLAYTMFLFY